MILPDPIHTKCGTDVAAVTWLVATGVYDEDGRELIKDVWLVWVTLLSGRRFQHTVCFAPKIAYDEGTGAPYLIHEGRCATEANALAQRVADRLNAGEPLNLDYWHEIDPEYGSDAYQSQGIEAQRAAEERAQG